MSAFPTLASADWLAEHLDDENLMVLDATVYLPTEPYSAVERYAQGHIRGAIFFNLDTFSDPEAYFPHMAPTPGRFSRLAGELGITTHTHVVVYDQKGLFSAARAWVQSEPASQITPKPHAAIHSGCCTVRL